MKRVLITGGHGFLGSQLGSQLRDSGYDVYTISRYEPEDETLSQNWICCDLTQERDVELSLSGKHFSAVIHAAGRTVGTAAEFSDSNVTGTRNLLKALESNPPSHIVFLSTFHVYGLSGTITEESICTPQNPYGRSKLAAERLVKDFSKKTNVGHTILRISNAYGCPQSIQGNGWNLIISDLARMAFVEHRLELRSHPETARDFVSLKDVCGLFQRILEKETPANDVFNVGSEKSFRIDQIAEIINQAHFERFGYHIPIKYAASVETIPAPFHFCSARLKEWILFFPKDRIRETVFDIFDFLDE